MPTRAGFMPTGLNRMRTAQERGGGINGMLGRAMMRWRALGSAMPSEASDWSVPILAAVFVLAPALLKWLVVGILPWLLRLVSWFWAAETRTPVGFGFGDAGLFVFGTEDPTLRFAFIVGSLCLTVCTLILFLSLFVHLLSADEGRSKKAEAIMRRTLAFVITSGVGVWAFLGFMPKR